MKGIEQTYPLNNPNKLLCEGEDAPAQNGLCWRQLRSRFIHIFATWSVRGDMDFRQSVLSDWKPERPRRQHS